MLISTEAVKGCALENGEGRVGTVHDLFFSDESWAVRYIVVSTGNWLSERRVWLPPSVVEQRDWPNQRLWVALTQQQIKDSPEVDTDRPVSRQKQMELDNYSAWYPVPWTPVGVVVPPSTGSTSAAAPPPEGDQDTEGDSHLRSVNEVTGYNIEAIDGEIGHVEELILDDREETRGPWELRYLVIDTRNWLPGRKVLVAPIWAQSISWEQRKVCVGLTREQIKGSPDFQPDVPINRRYEEILYDYYGKPKYWIGHST